MLLELVVYKKRPSMATVLSVVVLCIGITIATVTDPVVINNGLGLCVGVGATLITALYQIWAGTKQKQLEASSTQLLLAYTPWAALLLLAFIPMFENVGWEHREEGSLLGFDYTAAAVTAIIVSAALGVLVSLSTFLVIGATSSLSYNVVGHLKTIIILTGGCLIFEDVMSWKRLLGLATAMAGIVWCVFTWRVHPWTGGDRTLAGERLGR
jgi:solute carrier family 35 protein E3